MQTDLDAAVQAVHAAFMPAEQSTDRAAAQTARLLATLLEQRAALGAPIGTGASLVRKLARSLSAQIEAREEFVMAHKLARALPGELGLETFAYGDTEECPDDEVFRTMGSAGADPAAMPGNVVRLARA